MPWRIWPIAGAIAAVLLLAASATAKTTAARMSLGTPAAAPFAQAWAKVPTTAAGRRASNVVVFGAEQDIDGFNTQLSCCNEVWASWMGGEETTYGPFIQNNTGLWIPTGITTSAS